MTMPDGSPVELRLSTSAECRASESLSQRQKIIAADLGESYGGFRFAPLLLVTGDPSARLLMVGRWHLWIDGEVLHAEAALHGVWHEADGWRQGDAADAAMAIGAHPPFHGGRAADASGPAVLAIVAKSAADHSRTSVTAAREICYEVSESIAEVLRVGDAGASAGAVPHVMSLRSALSLARDVAREAVRRQLEVGVDDLEAYERYRRATDPSLMTDFAPADHSTRAWMRTHDAAVRQCKAIETEVAEQIDMLSGTLQAAATMWTAAQAKSSDDLNKVASAAAVGLGIPSVVLAYYGADQLVDLRIQAGATYVAWLPLVVGAVPAAVLLRNHQPMWWRWGRPAWLTALVGGTLAGVASIGSIAAWALG